MNNIATLEQIDLENSDKKDVYLLQMGKEELEHLTTKFQSRFPSEDENGIEMPSTSETNPAEDKDEKLKESLENLKL